MTKITTQKQKTKTETKKHPTNLQKTPKQQQLKNPKNWTPQT